MKNFGIHAHYRCSTTGTAFADSPESAQRCSPGCGCSCQTAQPAKPAAAKTSAEIAAEVEELRQGRRCSRKLASEGRIGKAR